MARKGKAAQTGKWLASDDCGGPPALSRKWSALPTPGQPGLPELTLGSSWPKSPCSPPALEAALFLETPLQPGPPFCGWGVSRNWVLSHGLPFHGAEAQAMPPPQLDMFLVCSVGVQSPICYLRGTLCPERPWLESPRGFHKKDIARKGTGSPNSRPGRYRAVWYLPLSAPA